MRLATIDVGTNTAQLLVVETGEEGLRRIHAAERVVRLGEGVDARGRIGEDAQARLLEALRAHEAAARSHGADRVVAAGTSALRDAANRTAVLDAVRAETGLTIDLLSGEQEAAWSFAAACGAIDSLAGPCLVVDVGGGSTELVAGRDPAAHAPRYVDAITGRASLDVGCVRLTERCFSSLPPAADATGRAPSSTPPSGPPTSTPDRIRPSSGRRAPPRPSPACTPGPKARGTPSTATVLPCPAPT